MKSQSLYKRIDPFTDVLLFAICLFGANIVWKLAVHGDESFDHVSILGLDATGMFNSVAHYVAKRCAWGVGLFRPTVVYCAPDVIGFESGFASRIIWGCTAIKQSFIWLVIMLLARGVQKRKLWFIPLGWCAIHIFNILRISAINMLCEFHPAMFTFWHVYFFKYAFYFMMFLMWVWWNERLSGPKKPLLGGKKATPHTH